MKNPVVLILTLACVLWSPPLWAEKIDMTPDELRETATHVVVGTVNRIYSDEEQEDDWLYTHFVAEVTVEKFEKGDEPDSRGPMYIRYWTRSWTGGGNPPPSTSGHRGRPIKGDKLRIYLARNAYDGFTRDNNDGGYNVIGANGFEEL